MIDLGLTDRDAQGRAYHLFRCQCGVEKRIRKDHVQSGRTRSCGCAVKEAAGMRRESQTKSVEGVPSIQHPLYSVWKAMKERCYKSYCTSYRHYGGRGIKVCDRWLESFESFVEDMGPRPDGHSIERKDNDGDYTPENCKWATAKEQANNKRVRNQWTGPIIYAWENK